MAGKIKIASSLPSKRKIAKKLGATQADIKAVDELFAKPIRVDRIVNSSSGKTLIKSRAGKEFNLNVRGKIKKSAMKAKHKLTKSGERVLSGMPSNGTITIKDLIALKRSH